MAESNNHGALMEDWMLPSPSPRTLMSNFWNEEFSSDSFSNIFGDNGSNKPQDGIEKNKTLIDSSSEETAQDTKAPLQLESNLFGANQKSTSHGGLAERMAARTGFGVLKIDTSQVCSSASIRSPVTIPPGVSPRELLESPVFLPNAIAQPSPTTAHFEVPTTKLFNYRQVDEEEESEENENGEYSTAPVIAPAEDGYNWRKYGQKQVRNSEHPRSYYKCTHPNCPVKKKVERSQEGHITEIVYKGSHSHPVPTSNHSPSVPLSHFNYLQADGSETLGSKPGHNTEISWGVALNGHFQDVHSGVLETKLTGSLTTTEIADTSVMESREAVDVSSTLSPNEKDDRATHGSFPSTYDGDEDESESKRRKMDVSANTNINTSTIDMAAMASRAVREPRIVVQTTSEVDILDDGYRWRKYGQKVVKGNPNPRSYYKCTHPGCLVRKHVERASNDLKLVITTYESKHNHEVPVARNSGGHSTSGPGAAPQASSLHRRPEPAQGSIVQFGSAAAYGSVCLPPQLSAASSGFCFGMLPPAPGMAVPIPSLGTAAPVQIPGHPPMMQGYTGIMLPRGEMKVNPEEHSNFPVANRTATATYQQLMSRLPQGPRM